MSAIPFQHEIVYPESDGQPIAETQLHLNETIYLLEAIEAYFCTASDVYVSGDLFLYFVEGDPLSVVSPDVFVVKGVPKKNRRVYKFWEEEGRGPCMVIEVTSDSTRDEDVSGKKALYERLGVEEYFLYDPLGDYLDPLIQGFRLSQGRYQEIRSEPDGSLLSQTTGLTLRMEGDQIRLVETDSGEPLPRYAELAEQHRLFEEQHRFLEDKIARLQAEHERLQAELNSLSS